MGDEFQDSPLEYPHNMAGDSDSDTPDSIDLADAYAVKTPEDSRRLYRQWANTYNETFIEANSYIYPRAVAELFAEHVPQSISLKIVDVGCGTGAVGSILSSLRPECAIDGYDISPEMLTQASLLKRPDHSAVYRNLVEVDLTDQLPVQKFDAMTSSGTFTHGHLGPETFLALIDLVVQDGWFVIGVNAEHFESRGFASAIDGAVLADRITVPLIEIVDVYAPGSPHHGDQAKVCIFCRKT